MERSIEMLEVAGVCPVCKKNVNQPLEAVIAPTGEDGQFTATHAPCFISTAMRSFQAFAESHNQTLEHALEVYCGTVEKASGIEDSVKKARSTMTALEKVMKEDHNQGEPSTNGQSKEDAELRKAINLETSAGEA